MNKIIGYKIKNCPVNYGLYKEICGIVEKPKDVGTKCADCPDCIIKRIVGLCKDIKEKDPIVAERDKQTGEIISIGGWTENPVYGFAQKILQLLEIEEAE